MNQDQLRAKTLALFQSILSNRANDVRKDVKRIQDDFVSRLDALQERMSRYEENIDEANILAFANEAATIAIGSGGRPHISMKKVREALVSIDGGRSLTEVLKSLLVELAQLAPRVALFMLKGDSVIGWHGCGFDNNKDFSDDQLKKISVPTHAETVFKAVIDSSSSYLGQSTSHRDNVQLLSCIGNILPAQIFATPLIIRDRIVAVIYADSGDVSERLEDTEAMEVLVFFASKVLDMLSSDKSVGTDVTFPKSVPSPSLEGAASDQKMSQPGQLTSGSSGAHALNSSVLEAGGGLDLDMLELDACQQHDEAIRFARLLVTEIKLYNDAKVQQGRNRKDIYNQVKDHIERSRQCYIERVPTAIRKTTNYFNDELVRILADGDPEAMGPIIS